MTSSCLDDDDDDDDDDDGDDDDDDDGISYSTTSLVLLVFKTVFIVEAEPIMKCKIPSNNKPLLKISSPV